MIFITVVAKRCEKKRGGGEKKKKKGEEMYVSTGAIDILPKRHGSLTSNMVRHQRAHLEMMSQHLSARLTEFR